MVGEEKTVRQTNESLLVVFEFYEIKYFFSVAPNFFAYEFLSIFVNSSKIFLLFLN